MGRSDPASWNTLLDSETMNPFPLFAGFQIIRRIRRFMGTQPIQRRLQKGDAHLRAPRFQRFQIEIIENGHDLRETPSANTHVCYILVRSDEHMHKVVRVMHGKNHIISFQQTSHKRQS